MPILDIDNEEPFSSGNEDANSVGRNESVNEYEPTTYFDTINEYFNDCLQSIRNFIRIEYLQSENWYENLKNDAKWLTDKASIKITFDDVMLVLTLYALFGLNIELAVSPPSNGESFDVSEPLSYRGRPVDEGFAVGLAICMFAFVFELIVNSWSKSKIKIKWQPFSFKKRGYIFSFYWTFDVIAILSLWPDIPWIRDPLNLGALSTSNNSSGSYTNSGRVVRLVRLVKFVRLYRVMLERRRARQLKEFLQEMLDREEIDYAEAQKLRQLGLERRSKLGSQLSSVIMKYVILVLLIMLLVIPILQYSPTDRGSEYGLSFLHSVSMNTSLSNTSKLAVMDEIIYIFSQGPITTPAPIVAKLENTPLVSGVAYLDSLLVYHLREGSYQTYEYVTNSSGTVYRLAAVMDGHQILYVESLDAIYLTLCIGFLMIIGYIIFTTDVQRLVLTPIERMMNMVEVVAQDPLQPINADKYNQQDKTNKNSQSVKMKTGEYETEILESSLEKVTGLLRVGFGEAGAGIIRTNLNLESNSQNESSDTVINAMLPGVRIYAIFGFCDIHHFEEINKALGGDVLIFVNTIAEIVHSSVHTWKGQCNKNLGNAFVIVWRIGDEDSLVSALNSTAYALRATTTSAKEMMADNMSRSMAMRSSTATTATDTRSHKGSIESATKTTYERQSNGSAPDEDDRSSMKSRRALLAAIATNDDNSSEHSRRTKRSNLRIGDDQSDSSSRRPDRRATKVDLKKIPGVDHLADSALVSYLKIIAEINRSEAVLRYRHEPRLMFGQKGPVLLPTTPRVPQSPINLSSVHHEDFKVRMGFGLHAGWGIEGAVGSNYKVDATYLSPHVNTAARLETASKQYKVPLLMSHAFHELLSDAFKEKCRQIDRVTVKGSSVPIGLFTYDCLQDQEFARRTRADVMLYLGIKRKKRASGTDFEPLRDLDSVSGKSNGNAPDESATSDQQKAPEEDSDQGALTPPPALSKSRRVSESDITIGASDAIVSPRKGSESSFNSHRNSPKLAEFFKPSPIASPRRSRLLSRDATRNESLKAITMEDLSPRSEENTGGQVENSASPPPPLQEQSPAIGIAWRDSMTRDSLSTLFPSIKEFDTPKSSPPSFIAEPPRPLSPPVDQTAVAVSPQNNGNVSEVSGMTSVTSSPRPRRNSLLSMLFEPVGEEKSEPPPPPPPSPPRDMEELILDPTAVGSSVVAPISLLPPSSLHSRSSSPMPLSRLQTNVELGENIPICFMTPDDPIEDILENDVDLLKLRVHISEEFMTTFNEGFKQYIQGDWNKAKQSFEKTDEMMRSLLPTLVDGDGPSQTLLNYMKGFNFESPKDWKGFRALTNK